MPPLTGQLEKVPGLNPDDGQAASSVRISTRQAGKATLTVLEQAELLGRDWVG